jgi:hypothetical protein
MADGPLAANIQNKISCVRRLTRVHFDLPARARIGRSRSSFIRSFLRGGRHHFIESPEPGTANRVDDRRI